MANYAEQLAYWYLRLNGFFLVSNFVFHKIQEDDKDKVYNADADLLAIRPPYYIEEIPYPQKDENESINFKRIPLESDSWLNEFNKHWLGAIIEVKGGENTQEKDVQKAFSLGRLQVSLNRLGLISGIEEASQVLLERAHFDYGEGSILKIVFSQIPIKGSWVNISMNDINEFIINRMTAPPNFVAKEVSRYFFPSELIQYIIWSANRHER